MYHQNRHRLVVPNSSAGFLQRSRLLVLTAIAALSLAASARAADVLLTVANAATMNASDLAISNRLTQLGFTVKPMNAAASTSSDATNKALVVVSATVTSGEVAAKFRDVTVPVIIWEQAVYDDMLWTLNGATDHNTIASQQTLNVVNPNHPLAAGLSGTNRVTTTPQNFAYGTPGTNAIVVATSTDGNNRPVIFAHDKGATLIDNTTTAKERGVGLFLTDDVPAAFTEAGSLLFDAAVSWATSDTSAPVIRVQPGSLTVSEGNGATATFTAPIISGQVPISVQWQKNGVDIAGATSRSYTTPVVTPADTGAIYTLVVTNAAGSVVSSNAVLTVTADTVAPSLVSVLGSQSLSSITLVFSEPITPETATNLTNYTVSGGVAVSGATLSPSGNTVTLATNPQSPGRIYTVTVNGLTDRSAAANPIAANTTQSFNSWIQLNGALLREVYHNINGTLVSDLTKSAKFPNSPDFISHISTFEIPRDIAENYGQRLSGWLLPDQTGEYVFYIAADDQAYLYLSTDESPSNKRLIAAEPTWSGNRTYIAGDDMPGRFQSPGATNKPANISTNVVGTISLEAGKRYYVEALHKEGGGGDNLAVAWKLASSTVAITNGSAPIGSANLATAYTPILPADYGQTVSGYQEDFSGTTLGTNWVFRGAATNTPYSVSSGMLHATTAAGDPNHLLLNLPYNRTNQEVLARMRIVNFGTGDAPRAGVVVGANTNGQGMNLHFRDFTQNNSGSSTTNRAIRLLDDNRAWGPGFDLRPDPTSTNKWQNNTWYWVRLKQVPNTTSNGVTNDVFGKVWLANGLVPEPANWQLQWDRYPADTIREGLAGIALGSNAGTAVFDVDYLLVKADGLPSVTVRQPPQVGDDSLGTIKNQPVTVVATKLLANDVDLEGRSLAITEAGPGSAQGGTVSIGADGITYSPRLDFVGYDSFSYRVSDGVGGTGVGAVYVFVAPTATPSANLVGVQLLPNGQANVRFAGIPGRTYTVQASQDLVTWTTIGTGVPGANGIMTVSDPGAGVFSIRFYRTVSQ